MWPSQQDEAVVGLDIRTTTGLYTAHELVEKATAQLYA